MLRWAGNPLRSKVSPTPLWAVGQTVISVRVASADQNVLNVLRWTVPGLLDETTGPTAQAMLAFVKFSDITATLVPQPTARP